MEVKNRSADLIPGVTVYSSDYRIAGFGPDARSAGESLNYPFAVTGNVIYYVQVWSRRDTRGAYSLLVH